MLKTERELPYNFYITLPYATVMFKSAGGFLTFQAQLNSSWIVFLLKITTTEVIKQETSFLKSLKKINLCSYSIQKLQNQKILIPLTKGLEYQW